MCNLFGWPKPAGPFSVGTTAWHFIDPLRVDPFASDGAAGPAGLRALMANVCSQPRPWNSAASSSRRSLSALLAATMIGARAARRISTASWSASTASSYHEHHPAGTVRDALHAFKFEGRRALAGPLADLLTRSGQRNLTDAFLHHAAS